MCELQAGFLYGVSVLSCMGSLHFLSMCAWQVLEGDSEQKGGIWGLGFEAGLGGWTLGLDFEAGV